ncbi:polysaccharide deacetylase family protein [Pleomorphovibrio marinus]|uniref:polysaccharide deacetylase family protein n=1 Tax=Pleomorphovibrio marinus TaxID=2164132 RepID=UPI000E0B10F1|nr:polysaccharide deacetylase family protein [Pleomorphovibrio marinus]
MSFFLHKVPSVIQCLYPAYIWHKPRTSRKVYLTFDDGPVPESTPFVLNELGKRGLKASFFMVGDNVRKNTSLAKEVLAGGHQIGNHTFHHIKGSSIDTKKYLDEVKACQFTLEDCLSISPGLFRPPYGRLKKKQATLLQKDFKIVMWEVLSGDFSPRLDPDTAIRNTCKYTQAGSIVLFHDQEKSASFLRKGLSDYLDFIQDEGFQTAWI